MKVNIKKLHPDAVIPKYGKPGDAGMDLVATSKKLEGENLVFGTGLAFAIPEGFVGLIAPRSSISRTNMLLTNNLGIIDSGYRGEVMAKFKYIGNENVEYDIGDKIAQIIIMPYPQIEFEEVNELSSTERGSGGFGSTGK